MKNTSSRKVLLRLPQEIEKKSLVFMKKHPEITTLTQALLALIVRGLEKEKEEK